MNSTNSPYHSLSVVLITPMQPHEHGKLEAMNHDASSDDASTERVGTGVDTFTAWLTVREAVLFCELNDLSRTPGGQGVKVYSTR